MIYSLFRPFLFSLDPEVAHGLALRLLAMRGILPSRLPPLKNPIEMMGLTFRNRVGLAAGFDKNGAYVDTIGTLGFGFIEVGTVTPLPQDGNDKPRLFRLSEDEAIINRMGFNNHGMEAMAKCLSKRRYQGVLGVNIGKNKQTPLKHAIDDYLACMETLAPYADYFTVNLSSPNTPGLRELQSIDHLVDLCAKLKECQLGLSKKLNKPLPLVVKLAPDMIDEDLLTRVQGLIDYAIDGVVLTNTSLSRDGLRSPLACQSGGLSGRPLFTQSTHCLDVIQPIADASLAVIGVGGIMSVEDARRKLEAGADLIQVYSGLIFKGPGLVSDLIAHLD